MLIPPTLARIAARPASRPGGPTARPAPNPFTAAALTHCPDCNGPVAHTSGCVTCVACGWGKCG